MTHTKFWNVETFKEFVRNFLTRFFFCPRQLIWKYHSKSIIFIVNGTVVILQDSKIPHGKFPSPSILIPRQWSCFRILKFLKLHFELLKTSFHSTIRKVKIFNLFCFDIWNIISWFATLLIFSPLEYDNGKLVPPYFPLLLKFRSRSLLSRLLNHFSTKRGQFPVPSSTPISIAKPLLLLQWRKRK